MIETASSKLMMVCLYIIAGKILKQQYDWNRYKAWILKTDSQGNKEWDIEIGENGNQKIGKGNKMGIMS